MELRFCYFKYFVADQQYFDLFHISFIVYDLDEEELLLTSTQDVDFKKLLDIGKLYNISGYGL